MLLKAKPRVSWLRAAYLVLAAIAMYLLISQLSDFSGSLSQLKNSRPLYDGLALLSVVFVLFFASLTYYLLAFKPLRYRRTVAVEAGINTLNRLLPAGLGAIGANYVYLTKCHHTKAQSGAIVAANTVIGIIANLLLLVVLLLSVRGAHFRYGSFSPRLVIIAGLVIVIAALSVLVIRPWRQELVHNFKMICRNLMKYAHAKRRLVYGLLSQMGLSLAYVLALYCSLRAVGGHLPLSSLMLTYSFAIWVGTIIPAPGGAGSVEAGLVTGLLAFRVDLAMAVAAVIIFRLISFWLPLILGIGPLIWSYRRGYL